LEIISTIFIARWTGETPPQALRPPPNNIPWDVTGGSWSCKKEFKNSPDTTAEVQVGEFIEVRVHFGGGRAGQLKGQLPTLGFGPLSFIDSC